MGPQKISRRGLLAVVGTMSAVTFLSSCKPVTVEGGEAAPGAANPAATAAGSSAAQGAASTDLYTSPGGFASQDKTITGSTGTFGIRIYFPANEGPEHSLIRPGKYPLIIFAHGNRQPDGTSGDGLELCPPDITQDYLQWSSVLATVARCGFVVVSPDVHDIIAHADETALRMEETVEWMRKQWQYRDTLFYPEVLAPPGDVVAITASDIDELEDMPVVEFQELEASAIAGLPIGPWPVPIPLGLPTRLGIIGHSWGARACSLMAVRHLVTVHSVASIAGTYDSNESLEIINANVPTLLISGTADGTDLAYANAIYTGLKRPKFQAAVLGHGHWDWFHPALGIHPCDPNTPGPQSTIGWRMASEFLIGFMTKYLKNRWYLRPYLIEEGIGHVRLGIPFADDSGNAMAIRWDDPLAQSPSANPGQTSWGLWEGDPPEVW